MSDESSRPARRRKRVKTTAVEISTFPSAWNYVLDRANVERTRPAKIDPATFKLKRTEQLLAAIGDPHHDMAAVHVAGTVGKGSIVAMSASMLHGCGYVVGEYTSPHLTDVRERIRVGGRMISKARFTEHVREIAAVVESLDFTPTYFELLTALAFKHFAEDAVDIALIEVGLGGRLDCTNVITPKLSIIGLIDFDHMHLLGKTIKKIAREKAGIMKKDVPVIVVAQNDAAEKVLRKEAARAGAPIYFVNQEIEFSFRFGASVDRGPHVQVSLFTDSSRFEHISVPLPGEHQAFNCGAALAAVDMLKSMNFDLPDQAVLDGLADTMMEGRMQLIWDHPRVVIDGAHNPAALRALFRGLGAHAPYDSLVCIFGCCEDKDISAMLGALEYGGDKVIFTQARDNPRAADPNELKQLFQEQCGKMSHVEPDIAAALTTASRAVGRDDLICVTGSFYLAGDTKSYLDAKRKEMQTT